MSTRETEVVREIHSDYQYGFSNPDEAKNYFFKSGRGISHDVVEAISEHKAEPEWMRTFRHKSLDYFFARPMPSWGAVLVTIRSYPVRGVKTMNVVFTGRISIHLEDSGQVSPCPSCQPLGGDSYGCE